MNEVDTLSAVQDAIAREGPSATRYYELGSLHMRLGDAASAAAAYRQCLALAHPDVPPGLYNNLGVALLQARRIDEAIDALQTALVRQPGYLRALVNLGKALGEAGRLDEALCALREALGRNPDYVPALVNSGAVYAASGDLDTAERALERALALAPQHIEALTALGIVRLQLGRSAAALDTLRAAMALAPANPETHMALAHALYVGGDWAASWAHFEYRLRRARHRDTLHVPPDRMRWDGQSDPEELWLLAEQGLGDQLQFVRYARLLAERGTRCVVACDPRLMRLLSSGTLGVRVVRHDSPAPPKALWLPLMSAPYRCNTEPHTVPYADGYLAAEPARLAKWRPRLPCTGLRVALVWQGNPAMETGRYVGRSPPLAALAPVFLVPGVEFISLQKGHGADQRQALPNPAALRVFDDLDVGADAFLDTAAILKCVDLLITSDTAIAHLAGGLRVATWLCLMHEPDWRWMRHGASTPWYDSLRLFRQTRPGDWTSVFRDVASALALLAAARMSDAAR
jgi:tetratricopeptide (TPR) repeat protein